MRTLLALAAALAAASCATMTADQCATADWGALGHKDGAAGETLAKADRREAACTKAGFAMDRSAYTAARHAGLGVYCTPQNGFEVGSVHGRYQGVCTDHDEPAFLHAHAQGLALANYKASIASARSALSDAAVEIASITETLDGYASGAVPFEAEGHNDHVLRLWSKRNYLQRVALPYWEREVKRGEKTIERYDQRGQYGGFDPAELGAAAPKGPPAYQGPTAAEARQMVAEVFASIGAK